MTLVSQLSFRDMYHRVCFFAMNDYLAELLEAAKIGADGALGYGYIDNEAGFTFEILASAKREGDRFIPLPNDGTISLKVRRGSAAHWNIILHPDVDTTPFEETIRFIEPPYCARSFPVWRMNLAGMGRSRCQMIFIGLLPWWLTYSALPR